MTLFLIISVRGWGDSQVLQGTPKDSFLFIGVRILATALLEK